jgi:hypothetical protein
MFMYNTVVPVPSYILYAISALVPVHPVWHCWHRQYFVCESCLFNSVKICSFWQCWYQHAVRIFCISNTLDVCQFQIVWSALIKGQQHEIFSIKNCLFFLSLAYQNDYFVCALYIQFLSNLNNIQSIFLKGQHHEILWKHLGITQLSLVVPFKGTASQDSFN